MEKSQKIIIRRFQEGDETEVIGLINEIMNVEFSEEQEAYPTGDIQNIETAYGQLGDAFFVAQADSRIVGTVAIKKEDNRVALLRRLFVASDFRNRQIGRRLISRALQFCQEVGYQEVIFKTTSRMQGAIELCQKRGFTQRAKLNLGLVELLKFSISLRDSQNAVKS